MKKLLAESSRRLDQKNRELEELRALLGERDARIEELLRRLHIAEKNADRGDLELIIQELKEQLEFLKKKLRNTIEDFEDQLRHRERVIKIFLKWFIR